MRARALSFALAIVACAPVVDVPPEAVVATAACTVTEREYDALIVCDNGVRALVWRDEDGGWSRVGCFWSCDVAPCE